MKPRLQLDRQSPQPWQSGMVERPSRMAGRAWQSVVFKQAPQSSHSEVTRIRPRLNRSTAQVTRPMGHRRAQNISAPLRYPIAYLDKEAVVGDVIVDGGSATFDSGARVALGPGGDVWLTGFRYANPSFGGGEDAYIARFDGSTLTREWGESYSSSSGVGTGSTQGLDIAVDAAGNSYITGFDLVDVDGSTYYYDAFLVKYNAAGTFQWSEPLTTTVLRVGGACGPRGCRNGAWVL